MCEPRVGGQWGADPHTGVVCLTEEALEAILNRESFEKCYRIDPEPLSRGQFAVVYRCVQRATGDVYAAKFSSRVRYGVDATADILHEVGVCDVLRSCRRIISLQDVFFTDTHVILVLEYAPGGDLHTIIDDDIVPYERDVISWLKQLLEGLVYMHDRSIVHLDIKPQNLVLMGEFPDCGVKLCDFEISRVLNSTCEIRGILGTYDYIAPEIIHYEPITTKTDIWSLGVLTYVLLTGFMPFGGETDQETMLEISNGDLDFPEELFEDISAHAIDFIKCLLVRQPHLRLSARECLEHPWMKADMKKTKVSIPLFPPSQPLTVPTTPSTPPSLATLPSSQDSSTVTSTISLLASRLSDIPKTLDLFSSGKGTLSPSSTPLAVTPSTMTPTVSTPVSSSGDIGLPPLHPQTLFKLPSSIQSSTSSLFRGNSRQSLEKLRTLSKSREVLIERLQMSNCRKNLSRSRERIMEGLHNRSSSREVLYSHKPISHSVEGLCGCALDQSEESIYKSCNSIFLPLLPMVEEATNTGRLHRNTASTDCINELGEHCSSSSPKSHMCDSRFSINGEEYTNLIDKYDTMSWYQCVAPSFAKYSVSSKTNKANSSEQRHGLCVTESSTNVKTERRKSEEQKKKQRINSTNVTKKEMNKEPTTATKIKTSAGIKPEKSVKRNGSVSHIEQRIKERHERIEKQKQEKAKTNSVNKSGKKANKTATKQPANPKRISSKHGTKKSSGNPKNTKSGKRPPKDQSSGSSAASSLESVKECLAPVKKPLASPKSITPEAEVPLPKTNGSSIAASRADGRSDIDEAYISLEEPLDDGIFSRSNSVDSSSTVLPDSPSGVVPAAVSSSNTNAVPEKSSQKRREANALPNGSSHAPVAAKLDASSATEDPPLTVISEEDEHGKKTSNVKNFERSASTWSDIGSMVSEASDVTGEDSIKTTFPEDTKKCCSIKAEDVSKGASKQPKSESKRGPLPRGRSKSIQASDALMPFKLLRSNSVHLDAPLKSKARPWKEVCDGSVGRALEKFNSKKRGQFAPSPASRFSMKVSPSSGGPVRKLQEK